MFLSCHLAVFTFTISYSFIGAYLQHKLHITFLLHTQPRGTSTFFLFFNPLEHIALLVCAQQGPSLFSSSASPGIWPIMLLRGGEQRGLRTQAESDWRSAEKEQQAAVAEMGSHLWITTQPPVEHLGDLGRGVVLFLFLFFSIIRGGFGCGAHGDW